jgi:hypothetical protein
MTKEFHARAGRAYDEAPKIASAKKKPKRARRKARKEPEVNPQAQDGVTLPLSSKQGGTS